MDASSSRLAGPSTQSHMHMNTNGHVTHGVDGGHSLEELERELPSVVDGQVPLGDLLSRIAQAVYAELTEMAETLPNMSDAARKRTIADWVVKTKRQIVKLYVIVRWARDADVVQKAMNITAFLLEQNRQFEEGVGRIDYAKDILAPAKLRNHDLLTALDVLTTGTYMRLPSIVKKTFIEKPRLTDEQVEKTLRDMEDVIRFRLRMHEVIPVEMKRYRVYDGRVHFTIPNLFETSLSLTGAGKEDGWFFVHVKFLHNVGGDTTGVQEFPRRPTGLIKQGITAEADARLSFYIPIPVDPNIPPEFAPPPKPKLPPGVVDAPLVRLYNYLYVMSLSYQLEILFYQARRMQSLGWKDYLSLEKSNDGKRFVAKYWVRAPTPTRPGQAPRQPVPLLGGTVSVSIVQTYASAKAGGGPARTPINRVLAHLERQSKARGEKLSDEVESFELEVKWEPVNGALAAEVPEVLLKLPPGDLAVDPSDLDFEALLRKAIVQHSRAILEKCQYVLQHGPYHRVFSPPGELVLFMDESVPSMRMHLCGNEYLVVSIDARTGKYTLRDTGDFVSAGRRPVLSILADRINMFPTELIDRLINLRYTTIIESAEQKALYLGLQTFRYRNFSDQDQASIGADVRMRLFIKLDNSPNHYLVILATDAGFRFAFIQVRPMETDSGQMSITYMGRLDVKRILGEETRDISGMDVMLTDSEFNIDAVMLRQLYAYCCARVAYLQVQLQLQQRGIPFTYTNPIQPTSVFYGTDLAQLHSSLSRTVPGLCVQAADILAGAPAAEAAMPNIRVIPLNWWSTKRQQVVMCVKLKYVQQPVGKRAGTSTVIRPSKRIFYDTKEAVVSFLSENVDTCVDEFLEEWAKVSKMVVIAREVSQMAKKPQWSDIRLLSFDLQTVEFAYAKDYTVLITCTDQLSATTNPSYELRFSRISRTLTRKSTQVSSQATLINSDLMDVDEDEPYNPHEDAEPFLRHLLRHGPLLTASLHELVQLLRNSLPVVCAVEDIRQSVLSRRKAAVRDVFVDTLAKAAGWHRVIYGDLRHALDFRLLTDRRVAILDASQWSHDGKGKASSSRTLAIGQFQPIPNFSDFTREISRDVFRTLMQQRAVAAAVATTAHVPQPPPSSAPTPVHTAPSPSHTYTNPPTPVTQTRDPRLQLQAQNQANMHGIPGLTASAASPRSHPPTPTLTNSTIPQRNNTQSLQGLAQTAFSPKLNFMPNPHVIQASPQMASRAIHQRSASSSSIQASPRSIFAQVAQVQAHAQAQAQAAHVGSPPFVHASPRLANTITPSKAVSSLSSQSSSTASSSQPTPLATPLPIIAHIDIGVVCDVEFVELLALRIHARIIEEIARS